jgi:hypothetical protein
MSEPLYECRRCHLLKTANLYMPSAFRRKVVVCRDCIRTELMARYDSNRARTDAIKMERGCADCGYRTNPVALGFDHLPEFKKTHYISDMLGSFTWPRIESEIAKCEVVCACCHAIRTQERGQCTAYWAQWRIDREGGAVVKESPELRLFTEEAV